MNDPGRLVILGAGPTGLGAAFRLRELGYDADQVVEQDDRDLLLSPQPQGVGLPARELVDRLLGAGDGDEPTLNRPDYVNGGAFAARPRGGA